MTETTWDAELAAISAWAKSYDPGKTSAPPDAITTRRFTPEDIRALFAATTSLKHHLALVDQHSIRDWMEGPRATPEARQAALDSWTRLHP
jgi:hypothetical protein